MTQQNEAHLRVYGNRSVLVQQDGSEEIFPEGRPSTQARRRHALIDRRLAGGFLNDLVQGIREHRVTPQGLEDDQSVLLATLVSSITSEVGRALVGLAVLVLSIKAIEPEQSVRLHKGGSGTGGFSWQDGLPMRSLDSKYCTPVLRQQELARMNNYGIFMTRSLAENYPYSMFYKAAMRGAKSECFTIIDLIEDAPASARPMLENLISMLINSSERSLALGDQVLAATAAKLRTNPGPETIKNIVAQHVGGSTYGARLLEVAMHSLFQVFDARGVLDGHLEPLSQMRSANKKHGNVGDIEIVLGSQRRSHVLEAWDAKYGKPYLRDELEELSDKLESHGETTVAGFVVDREPEIDDDIRSRIDELQTLHEVDISLQSFDGWVDVQIERYGQDATTTMNEWLTAYAESLARRRLAVAPIDEPADQWLEDLLRLLR